ncbi:unnamed protein product [Staurois parvus]|uniref:Uncharacterized protein n=1 Tax=Staurois parvus TaxID=386267 RepID=A0ABN9F0P4_9NEOB|nr:unnamed protein product [Staurois parvus]
MRCVPRTQRITDLRKGHGHVISCVQSQLITDHQGTDDQCALMISVAPEVPPVSVHQYQLSVLNSAMCQCPSVPHQCHISVPI